MGDIAEMMLDGILDANGEYTGHNYGHPVYPKGWFGKGGKRKHKDTESQKKFWAIKKEISARVTELIASGMKENGALNEARREANLKHGSDWRNLQYH